MKKVNFNKRNLKYGGVAVTFTAVVVVAVIILNVIITSLGSTFSWYTDLTGSSLYSISDSFKKELDNMLSANKNEDPDDDIYLNIVLLMDEDSFRNYDTSTLYVYRTIKQIVSEYDNIELVSINSTQSPDFVKEHYMKTTVDTPAITDVIIEIADKDHNSKSELGYKKYSIQAFYAANSDSTKLIGYNAETTFLSAVAQLTGKVNDETAPVVYYLQGHGEPSLEEAADWKALFEDAGFSVKTINLLSEDFPSQISYGSLVFINLPKSDLYSDENGVSEVKKIRSFAGASYGNVIVTVDSSTTSLPALNDLMSEWGVGIGGAVTDDEHSVAGSGAVKVLADYSLTKDSVSKQVIDRIVGSSNPTPTLFTSPRAINVYEDSKIIVPANGKAHSAVLLAPYSTAKIDGEAQGAEDAGLATITTIIGDVNEETATTHFVVCLGSSDFVNKNLDTSNANKTLIYYLLERMWSGSITFENIKYKPFDDNALTVTTAQTNTWTVVCVAVIPLALIAAGVIVWIRRRHS